MKRILLTTLKISLVLFVLVFFVGPLIFKFCYPLQRHLLFLNFVNWPLNPNYNDPSAYGLHGTKNLYVQSNDNVDIGVWHILPENIANETASDDYDKALSHGEPVFIYMHGNSGNRAAGHRIDLYKILRRRYHVIAFDYRSYGDSTFVQPTEDGLVNDGRTIIEHFKNKTDVPIFVWGHSLGTGVSTHVLHILATEGVEVNGLVLESPFNNLRDEISEHPSAWIFHNLPWFKFTITDSMYANGLKFESDQHIAHFNSPVMILHAEDDIIVPFNLGYKLFKSAVANRDNTQGTVDFVRFRKEDKYGHKYICKAPELATLVSDWVQRVVQTS